MSARIEAALAKEIARAPEQRHMAILRAEDSAEALEARLPRDVTVRHRYARLPGLAVTATGTRLQELARLPGLAAIESDHQVRA